MAKRKEKEPVRTTTARGQRAPKGVLRRLLRTLFEFYPVLLPVTMVCILINAIVSSMPSIFMQNVIAVVDESYKSGDWSAVSGRILTFVAILVTMYIISLIAGAFYTQMMAIITQGSLKKLREKMFSHMQDRPIRDFDPNGHGDIMSYYTNDVDTLRQLISQSIPEVINSAISVVMVFFAMLNNSWIMTILSLILLTFQMLASAKLAKLSGKHFVAQQANLGRVNGFIEEMMTGQKVVKVFCHEEKAIEQFGDLNEQLRTSAHEANRWANTLGPINTNLGHISYVICAMVGSALSIATGGTLMSTGRLVAFLTLNRNFSQPISQITQQLNSIIMALAGAERVFNLLDEAPEADNGYVELVNAKEAPDGTITETTERTGLWAWKHPHTADGSVSYRKLSGGVTFDHVDFGYTPEKTVLHVFTTYA